MEQKIFNYAASTLVAIILTGGGYSLPSNAQESSKPPAVIPPPGIELGAPDYIPNPHRGHFSIGILQDKTLLTQVVARISIKSKRVNGFLDERFLGDYLYDINQRASFVRGSNPEDRVVVRLFDLQNRLLGYTEFELLDDNASASLILPGQPNQYGLLRTVVGIDSDRDGTIDRESKVYDYFTQVNQSPNQNLAAATAVFLDSAPKVNLNLFKAANLPSPTHNSSYSSSFTTGNFSLANQSIPVFKPWLSPTIIVLPGQLVSTVTIKPDIADTFDITRQILNYNEVELKQSQGKTIFQQ
jgi:hypothetical protein